MDRTGNAAICYLKPLPTAVASELAGSHIIHCCEYIDPLEIVQPAFQLTLPQDD